VETGHLVVEPLITHRFHYTQAPEVYHMLDTHPEDTIKVVFTYE